MPRSRYVTSGTLAAASARWLKTAGRPRGPASWSWGKAGLLIVDMQGFFLDPRSPAFLPAAPAIKPRVRRLLDAFRARKRPVAHARYASPKSGPMTRRWRKRCPRTGPRAAPAPGLEPRPGELDLVKTGYSAFRGARLKDWLRRRKVRDLVICGVMTHLCVESSARDAFDEGLRVFIPADASAAPTEALHLSALRTLSHGFATLT